MIMKVMANDAHMDMNDEGRILQHAPNTRDVRKLRRTGLVVDVTETEGSERVDWTLVRVCLVECAIQLGRRARQ